MCCLDAHASTDVSYAVTAGPSGAFRYESGPTKRSDCLSSGTTCSLDAHASTDVSYAFTAGVMGAW